MDEVLAKKQKKILRLTGITIGVYLIFRYLLPVVIPFLLAAVLAVCLRKPYGWLHRKLRLPKGAAATAVTFLLVAVICTAAFFLIREMIYQAGRLIEHIPAYAENLDGWMQSVCVECERWLKLEDGEVFAWLSSQWNKGLETIGSNLMAGAVDNGVALVSWTVKVGAGLVVVFLATILMLTSWENIGKRVDASPFHEEIFALKNKFLHAGAAYIKSQLIIMTLTALICCIGLAILGNPYSVISGIAIGLLDALPLFGTGTVFIPWVIIELFRRNFLKAIGLAVIYLICYFLREIMEAKVMGNSIGLGPLESLAAIYVGLKLFGIIGVILGPFGLIAIRELSEWG